MTDLSHHLNGFLLCTEHCSCAVGAFKDEGGDHQKAGGHMIFWVKLMK